MIEKVQMKVHEFIRKFTTQLRRRTSSPPRRTIWDIADQPDLCGFDVLQAIKQMPEVAAGLAAAAFTLLGMLAAIFGLVGPKPTIVSPAGLLST